MAGGAALGGSSRRCDRTTASRVETATTDTGAAPLHEALLSVCRHLSVEGAESERVKEILHTLRACHWPLDDHSTA